MSLAVLAWAGVVRARFIVLLVASMLYLHLHDTFMRDTHFFGVSQLFLNELGCLFFSGVLLALLKDKLPLRWGITLAAVVFIVVAFLLGRDDWHYPAFVYLLVWPYSLVSADLLLRRFHFLNRFDVSYGVYIYGFVVQQCMVFLLPGLTDPVLFMLFSIVVSFCVGMLSWVLVERSFLHLKNVDGNALKRFLWARGRTSVADSDGSY